MFTMKSVWKRLLVAGLVIVGSLANAEHLEEVRAKKPVLLKHFCSNGGERR
jgi:hypothetical protein